MINYDLPGNPLLAVVGNVFVDPDGQRWRVDAMGTRDGERWVMLQSDDGDTFLTPPSALETWRKEDGR